MFAVSRNSWPATWLLRRDKRQGLRGGGSNLSCWWKIIIKSIKSTGGEDKIQPVESILNSSCFFVSSCENWFSSALTFGLRVVLVPKVCCCRLVRVPQLWITAWALDGVTLAMPLRLWIRIDWVVLFIMVQSKVHGNFVKTHLKGMLKWGELKKSKKAC